MSEKTEPEIIPHPLHDAILKHAKLRPLTRVQPDWWIRSYEPGVSSEVVREVWNPVLNRMHVEQLDTGRKFVRLVMRNQESPLDGLEVTDKPGREVLCCTAAEAKRAGLVAVEVPAGGAQ
ncbi:hypothetical protein N8J89_07810 [Crossiella sp. CA-258035]|uniref:hypothetical protein n=1 Tax=Crossiella sp. CA-258035 TaxID=2981138 RepID=UPI0024BC0B76|nr:hypothetical protein [Crossiella sp. CA-258035]WHT20959.1 hypothetical protein N8J89_07810 [Crossiella sp. CA-258035]